MIPHVFDQGLDVLRRVFGLEVREMSTARMPPSLLSADPEARAADLNAAFADPSVQAIVASIGGVDSVQHPAFLDPAIAIAHPKVLLGFSDTATQLAFYNQAGLVTFNGPSVMSGFAQIESFGGAVEHVRSILFEPTASFDYRPFEDWTDGYPDWGDPANAGAVGERRAHDGWHWLQGAERAEGRLFGGCGEVLEMIKGTRFWPEPSFWAAGSCSSRPRRTCRRQTLSATGCGTTGCRACSIACPRCWSGEPGTTTRRRRRSSTRWSCGSWRGSSGGPTCRSSRTSTSATRTRNG